MNITNKLGLPEALVNAVANDPPDKTSYGTLSVTGLIAPAYQRMLKRKHRDELTEDVSDRIWALIGKSSHAVLEAAAQPGDFVEERVYRDVEVDGQTHTVSARFDQLTADGILTDWKITSAWSMKDAKVNGKADWAAQLNVTAYLLRGDPKYPDPVLLQIVAIARDWNNANAMRDNDYPGKAEAIRVAMWSDKEVEQWLKERIRAHTAMSPKPCSDEERWYRPGKVAVTLKGRVRALKLADTLAEAEAWVANNPGKIKGKVIYEERPAVYPRCDNYCAVADFCPHYQSTKEES